MKLNQLINTNLDIDIKGISSNSKKIEKDYIFVCTPSLSCNRHDFIDEAIKNGAIFVICTQDIKYNINYIKVEQSQINDIFFDILNKFYENPLSRLKLIGVTGTDGKTSTTTIIQTLLGSHICGYIGTNGYSCINFKGKTDNTTPSIEELFYIFYNFVKNNIEYVAMEVSSEGLYFNRLDKLKFEVGSFTNIKSEHLNTHKTLENYVESKIKLFNLSKKSVLNIDSSYFNKIINENKLNYFTYGYKDSNLKVIEYEILKDHTKITYLYNNISYKIISPLVAKFNIENLTCALSCLLVLGFKFDDITHNIDKLKIDGRMIELDTKLNFRIIVDYAHTPNGLTQLFNFINNIKENRIITVIGQAGQRDPYKRKDVGKIVSDNSDIAIFTSEDPRNEDPNLIIDMMCQLTTKNNIVKIIDRYQAIKYAIENAHEKDIVLILGKGSENYMIIGNQKIEFCDIDVSKKILNEFN